MTTRTVLPQWLLTTELSSQGEATGSIKGAGSRSYIDSVIGRAASVLGALLESDPAANVKGLMQSIGPVPRLIGTLLLLFAGAVAGSFTALFGIVALLLFVALFSRVKLATLLFRISPAIFITALVTAPALFSLGVGEASGADLLRFSIFGTFFSVGSVELYGWLFLVTRVTVMVLISTLLLLTTTRVALFRALGALPLPRSFVSVLFMTYRHLLILLKRVEEIAMAKRARTIRAPRSRDLRSWFASRVASIISRSLVTAEEVAQAMVSRGFNGTISAGVEPEPAGRRSSIRGVDCLWLASSFFVFFMVLGS